MDEQLCLFVTVSTDPRSVVYFAERRGYIKIGTTTNPYRRMRELKARFLLVLPGDVFLEAQLHRRFANSRMVGEWFAPTPELWDYIYRLRSQTDEDGAA